MKEIKVFNDNLSDSFKEEVAKMIHNFNGIEGGVGIRNVIKIISIDAIDLNIKAFKIPNLINQFAYRFIRKSKAQRSFEYANKLIDLQVGTPKPIAYFEYRTCLLYTSPSPRD